MEIQNIVLYGLQGQVRTLTFRTGAVNIITGKSRSGKTALLDIVDYCLGRNTCNVPAGRIRNSVSWFSMKLRFATCEAFIARRNPPPTGTTSPEVFLQIGNDIPIPSAESIVSNITVDGLIQQLDRLLGIAPNENVPPPGQTRRPLRATIDHAKFLIFQGQSEIASREFLFHRQGEPFIPQAIKDTLPYFLGAVSDDSLLLRAEQRDVKRELQLLERQQAEIDRLIGEGNIRAQALLSEAADAGFSVENQGNDPLVTLQALTQLASRSPEESVEIGQEAARLREEQVQLRRQYQQLREELDAARLFNAAQQSFNDEASDQTARLETIDLFPRKESPVDECPLCHSHLETPVPAVIEIQASLNNLRNELQALGEQRPRVDEHIAALQDKMVVLRQRIAAGRVQLQAVESLSEQFQRAKDIHGRQLHVLGRISLYLENIPRVTSDFTLGSRIEALRKRLARLDEQLKLDTVREAVDSALNRIGRWMSEGAQSLMLEYAPSPYRLDISALTVIADADPRPVRMNQMGSAENWLGCHLIAHLSLHRWFIEKNRPVPRFLFIDQPTSAYYPPDSPVEATNEDRLAVTRMYRWLMDTVGTSMPGFQLIIVDHADLQEDWFRDAVVERWRGEVALVPEDWSEV